MLNILRRKTSLQILSFYVLFMVPVLLGGAGLYLFERRELQAAAQSADLGLAQALALETEGYLRSAAETASALARSPAADAMDFKQLTQDFRNQARARSDISLYFVLAPNGKMVLNFPFNGETIGQDFSHRDYFQGALASSESVISSGRTSATTHTPVATVAHRITDAQGKVTGVVAINLSLEKLAENLQLVRRRLARENQARFYIVDGNGRLLANTENLPFQADLLDKLPGLGSALRGESGNMITREEEREWLHSYMPIMGANWAIIVQRPTDETFATIKNFQYGLIATLALLITGASLFWFMLNRRVIAPLARLAQAARTFRPDQPSKVMYSTALAPEHARQDEIGELIAAFRTMEANIHSRFHNVHLLMETGRRMLATLEPSVIYAIATEQVHKLTGCDGCMVLCSEQGQADHVTVASTYGMMPALAGTAERETFWQKLVGCQERVYIADTANAAATDIGNVAKLLAAEGWCSLLVLPLSTTYTASKTVLVIYNRHPHAYDAEHIALLENLAHQTALALGNATLYQKSDQRLQAQLHTLEAIMRSMEEGVLLEDPNGQIVYANQRFSEFVGLSQQALTSGNYHADRLQERLASLLQHPETVQRAIRLAEQNGGTQEIEFRIDGFYKHQSFVPTKRDIRLRLFQVCDANGQLIGKGKIFQDVTRQNEAERVRRNLLAIVSHELRTPLTTIKGNATSLLETDVVWDLDAQQESLRQIVKESDRMAELITGLLEASQVEAGTLKLSTGVYRLETILEEAITQTIGEDERHRLHIHLPAQRPLVHVDRRRLRVVFRNLLENAQRYAGPDPLIDIAIKYCPVEHGCPSGEAAGLYISVADTGPGIPAHLTERIFDHFYQVDGGRERSSSGVGLGLAICRGFVEAHGGRLWAANRADGHSGAVFHIWLPPTVIQAGTSEVNPAILAEVVS
jgi:signal transduction histidine kinase